MLTVGRPTALQDTLNLLIVFNEPAGQQVGAPLPAAGPSRPGDLFDQLARYSYEYPYLQGDIEALATGGTASSTAALKAFQAIAGDVAATWQGWVPPPPPDPVALPVNTIAYTIDTDQDTGNLLLHRDLVAEHDRSEQLRVAADRRLRVSAAEHGRGHGRVHAHGEGSAVPAHHPLGSVLRARLPECTRLGVHPTECQPGRRQRVVDQPGVRLHDRNRPAAHARCAVDRRAGDDRGGGRIRSPQRRQLDLRRDAHPTERLDPGAVGGRARTAAGGDDLVLATRCWPIRAATAMHRSTASCPCTCCSNSTSPTVRTRMLPIRPPARSPAGRAIESRTPQAARSPSTSRSSRQRSSRATRSSRSCSSRRCRSRCRPERDGGSVE